MGIQNQGGTADPLQYEIGRQRELIAEQARVIQEARDAIPPRVSWADLLRAASGPEPCPHVADDSPEMQGGAW